MTTFTGRGCAGDGPTRTVVGATSIESFMDEAELIDRASAGDTDAYGELYTRHVADVAALARRLCRDRDEADDVVSETFCNTLRALRAGGGPSDDLKPYLLRSVRNTLIKVRTRGDTGRADPAAPDTLDRPDGVDPYCAPGAASVAFGAVSDRYQRVLWSVEIEGTPTSAVATAEAVSAPAAASLAYRARCALRRAYVGASMAPARSAACKPIRSLIPSLVDGGLASTKAAMIHSHTSDCDECRAALAGAEKLHSGLGDRAWWALAPLGLRALVSNAGRLVVGTAGVSPIAATAAVVSVVSGSAALTFGAIALLDVEEPRRDAIRTEAAASERPGPDPFLDRAEGREATRPALAAPTEHLDDDRPSVEAVLPIDPLDVVDPTPGVPSSSGTSDADAGTGAASSVGATGDDVATSTPGTDGSVGDSGSTASADPSGSGAVDHGSGAGEPVEAVGAVVDHVAGSATHAIDEVVDTVDATVDVVTDVVDDVAANLPVVAGTVDHVTDVVDGVADAVVAVPATEAVTTAVDTTLDLVANGSDPVTDIVDDAVDDAVDAVADTGAIGPVDQVLGPVVSVLEDETVGTVTVETVTEPVTGGGLLGGLGLLD